MKTLCTTLASPAAVTWMGPYAALMSRALHWQFREIHIRQRPVLDVRKEAQATFGLTKRQALGNEFDLAQTVEAWRGGMKYRMAQMGDRLASWKTREHDLDQKVQGKLSKRRGHSVGVASTKKKTTVAPSKAAITLLWQRQVRWVTQLKTLRFKIARLETQLAQMKTDLQGPPKVCFGGRALLRQSQKFQAIADQLQRQAERSHWPLSALETEQHTRALAQAHRGRAAWRAHRQDRFGLVGSKGETGGNQTAQYDPSTQTLKLRLPSALLASLSPEDRLTHGIDRQGRVTFENVRFRYGQAEVTAAVAANQALTWHFFRDDKGRWHAHVSLEPVAVPIHLGTAVAHHAAQVAQARIDQRKANRVALGTASPHAQGFLSASLPSLPTPRSGFIGIDLNVDHVAVVMVNPDGNPIARHRFPFPVHGTPSGVAQAMIGDLNKALTDLAEQHQCPLAIEDLDFTRKKADLKAFGKAHARRLSSFATAAFRDGLQARCARHGIFLAQVNPAYTSVIGRIKYAQGYAMSRHHAAALVIARRAQGWGERFVCMAGNILEGPGRNLSRTLPVRWRSVRTLARPSPVLSSGRTTDDGPPSGWGPSRAGKPFGAHGRGGGAPDSASLSLGCRCRDGRYA